MKHTEQTLPNCELQPETNSFPSNEQISHNDITINQFMCDEELLRTQIKQKYREHLTQINQKPKSNQFCAKFIQNLILTLFAFLQQLWIEIIPQSFRGRYFAEKSSKIMDNHPQLNCGNISLFLSRMKIQSKHFFIIFEQSITHSDECFDLEENLFDNSEDSNKKLNYILQCETISLNAQDLIELEKNQNPPFKLSHFLKPFTKCPLLLVCRYNFLQELKVMGEIQLSYLPQESFIELLDEVKKNIFQLKNLQSECKRQVLMEIFHPNRQEQPVR